MRRTGLPSFVRGAAGRFEPVAGSHFRHVGLYGYRRAFLERLGRTPPCAAENLEKLEQLRALALGGRMIVLDGGDAGIGVDTPADVAKAEALLRAAGRLTRNRATPSSLTLNSMLRLIGATIPETAP